MAIVCLVYLRYVTEFVGLAGFVALLALAILATVSLFIETIRVRILLFLLVFPLVLCVVFLARETLLGVGVYRVGSESMYPTLKAGEFILVDQWWSHAHKQALPCDVIAFKRDAQVYVKRVAAVAGDKLSKRDNRLLINGSVPSCVTYASDIYLLWPPEDSVPPHHVFLLGDNARRSLDSRHNGTVPLSSLVGTVTDSY